MIKINIDNGRVRIAIKHRGSCKASLIHICPCECIDEDTDLIPTLHECISNLLKIDYGFSTNFVKCNDLIINYAKLFNVPQENMPKKMFVFTDMQFNNACSNERITFENNDSNDSLDTVYKTIVKNIRQIITMLLNLYSGTSILIAEKFSL